MGFIPNPTPPLQEEHNTTQHRHRHRHEEVVWLTMDVQDALPSALPSASTNEKENEGKHGRRIDR